MDLETFKRFLNPDDLYYTRFINQSHVVSQVIKALQDLFVNEPVEFLKIMHYLATTHPPGGLSQNNWEKIRFAAQPDGLYLAHSGEPIPAEVDLLIFDLNQMTMIQLDEVSLRDILERNPAFKKRTIPHSFLNVHCLFMAINNTFSKAQQGPLTALWQRLTDAEKAFYHSIADCELPLNVIYLPSAESIYFKAVSALRSFLGLHREAEPVSAISYKPELTLEGVTYLLGSTEQSLQARHGNAFFRVDLGNGQLEVTPYLTSPGGNSPGRSNGSILQSTLRVQGTTATHLPRLKEHFGLTR
jgi:hypothetical protein